MSYSKERFVIKEMYYRKWGGNTGCLLLHWKMDVVVFIFVVFSIFKVQKI